jgi:hypothetical protein
VTHETRDGGPLGWCGRLSEEVALCPETAYRVGYSVTSGNDG